MSDNKIRVWVTGHKSPDTDSICSAIAYANLKNTVDESKDYFPGRAGDINEETRFVLDYFGADEPELIVDVRQQLSDVEFHRTTGVDKNISIKEAWETMKKEDMVTLPVTEGDELDGVVTIGDLSRSVFNVLDRHQISEASTPYINIVKVLDAEVVTGDTDKNFDNGKLVLSACVINSMVGTIDEGDIVVLEDRAEAQRNAVEMGAGCVIICNGAEVDKDAVKAASVNGCIILKAKYDPFTCARLIIQSVPIRSIYKEREHLITFRLNDFLDDITDQMTQVRYRYFPVEDEEGKYVGLVSKGNLLSAGKKQIILVDHEEKAQAVDGIESAELLEIIDHHRLGGMTTPAPLFARVQPVGCCCTIIYNMYKEAGVVPDKKMAGLMLSAIISDTLLFKSPTCTPMDKAAGEELAKLAGVTPETYAKEMFKAGSNLGSKDTRDIFFMDFKKFEIEGKNIVVGPVSKINTDEIDDIHKKISGIMDEVIAERCLDNAFLMITDIMEESSKVVCGGEGGIEIIEEAFGKKADGDAVYLEGVVSRKKQMIPSIMGVMQ